VFSALDNWYKPFSAWKTSGARAVVVFDSRRNPLKRRAMGPGARRKMLAAKATLAAAATATADDDVHELFLGEEWEEERKELDAAMKEVASYDGVLIALWREWAQARATAAGVFEFVCAPWEADHQLVQLQRDLGGTSAADAVFILTEDGDVTHLGGVGGTVLGGYINKKGGAYRAAAPQAESATVKRCLRAALLGTDYSGNKPVVRSWKEVDAVAEALYSGIVDGELADLSTSAALHCA
jgi:hypothetical protein